MELDIYVPSIHFAIEFDGAAWHDTEEAHKKERQKYDICRERFRYLLHYAQRIQRHGAEPYMDMSHLQGREHFIIPFAVPLFLALAAEVVVWNIGSL